MLTAHRGGPLLLSALPHPASLQNQGRGGSEPCPCSGVCLISPLPLFPTSPPSPLLSLTGLSTEIQATVCCLEIKGEASGWGRKTRVLAGEEATAGNQTQ